MAWTGWPERRVGKRRASDPPPPTPVERRSGVERRQGETLTPWTLDADPSERTRVAVRREGDRMKGIVSAAKRAGGHATTDATGQPPVIPPPPSDPAFDGFAELPRVTPSYTYSPPLGGVTHTPTTPAELSALLTGQSLNGNTLQKGDVIQLTAGTQYTDATYKQQTFPRTDSMPQRTGASSSWIYVKTNAINSLPASGSVGRVNDTHKQYMPLFRQMAGGGVPPLIVADYASKYAFVGIALDGGSVSVTSRLGQIGPIAPTTVAQLPTEIVMDRCHGTATRANNCSRILLVTTQSFVMVDSHMYCTAASGLENQAFSTFNAVGPWLIDNCYLVGGGENFICGGASSTLAQNNPGTFLRDVTFRRCHFYKPLTWNQYHPTFDGTDIVCKNLFELKWGGRVLVEDCVLENFWLPDQQYAVNFKSNALDAPSLLQTHDVTMRWCKFINIANFVNITRGDGIGVDSQNITIRQIGIVGLNAQYTGTTPWTCGRSNLGTNGVTYENVTGLTEDVDGTPTGAIFVNDYPDMLNTVIRNNIMHRGAYGIKYSGLAEGTASLAGRHPGYICTGNAFIGCNSSIYPANNTFPASTAAAGFTDLTGNDFRLTAGSVLKGTATGGGDPGVDWNTLATRTSGCVSGSW